MCVEKGCQARAENLMKSHACFALPLLLLPVMAGIFALSARWAALSHSLSGILALSGYRAGALALFGVHQ
jgi:hypothetical protein